MASTWRTVRAFITRLWSRWFVRSLVGGAFATALDLSVGMTVLAAGAPTRAAAMSGTILGATFNFFYNRAVAFKDSHTGLSGSALRYVLVSLATSTVHGQVVVLLKDGQALPYPVAKILADLIVLSGTQLLLLRYVVFPKAKPTPEDRKPAEDSVSR